jgi:hypothetical protein
MRIEKLPYIGNEFATYLSTHLQRDELQREDIGRMVPSFPIGNLRYAIPVAEEG